MFIDVNIILPDKYFILRIILYYELWFIQASIPIWAEKHG